MARGNKQTDVLKIRIDPELLKLVRDKAKSLNMDVSMFVRWCIQTGLVLGDLNTFVRARIKENP